MRLINRRSVTALAALWLLAAVTLPALAASKGAETNVRVVADTLQPWPYLDYQVHKVGNVGMTVTNYGIYGTQLDASMEDPETGLTAPSCQYPFGSDVEYLFQGSLWIGAVVDIDTLVSTGHDGWQHVFEMFADPYPTGQIVKRSTRPGDPAYSPDAVSEADYIATYYDTLTDQSYVAQNPDDGRPHIPLGLKIVQESYSWSGSACEDFIIFRYRIKNIGSYHLQQALCGLYFDCDVRHNHLGAAGMMDDISGSYWFSGLTPSESVFVAWSADNDGDPSHSGQWDYRSPRAVFGTSPLDYPTNSQPAFNWWVSWGDDPSLDWGPRRQENDRDFGTGGLGTPAGDRNKYYVMATAERDYDQAWAAKNHSSEGWMPPSPSIAADVANGYDTRFLLSFGTIDLAPGDSTEFAFVVAMGDNFHRHPLDFQNLFNPNNPQAFYDSLDFSDLTTNILTARELYRQLFVVISGDADRNGVVDVVDAIYLINYIFMGGPAPSPVKVADVNADCEINIADVVYLIRYVFSGGSAPAEGCAR